MSESESHSVVFDSLQSHGLYSPWNSPGQKTGVGSLSLLHRVFTTNPGIKPRSPSLQADSLPAEPPGMWVDALYQVEKVPSHCQFVEHSLLPPFLSKYIQNRLLLTTSTSNPQSKLPASPVWISTIHSTPTRAPCFLPYPLVTILSTASKLALTHPWRPPTSSHSPAHSTPAPPASWLLLKHAPATPLTDREVFKPHTYCSLNLELFFQMPHDPLLTS